MVVVLLHLDIIMMKNVNVIFNVFERNMYMYSILHSLEIEIYIYMYD